MGLPRKRLTNTLAGHEKSGWELRPEDRFAAPSAFSAAESGLVGDFVEQFALGIEQLNSQGDRTVGVGRTTEAGIVGAHHGGNAVQHAFGQLRPVDVVFGNLLDAASDGEIVVPGGYNQVGPGDSSVLVYFVVMNEGAARGLDHPDAFEGVQACGGANVLVENLRIVQQGFDAFKGIGDFDEAGVVVEKRAVRDRAKALMKLAELGIRDGRSAAVGGVEAA